MILGITASNGYKNSLAELVKKFLALNVRRLWFYMTNVTGKFCLYSNWSCQLKINVFVITSRISSRSVYFMFFR